MNRVIYRSLCLMVLAVFVSAGGCDKKDREQRSQTARGVEAPTRPARAASFRQGSQQSHSDAQLYKGLLERLRQENRELRRQTAQALDTLKQMQQRLQVVKKERGQAISGFKEVLDAAGQLKQDSAQKNQEIQQLEQENQELRSTIAELTAQLDQAILDSEASDTISSEFIEDPPSP